MKRLAITLIFVQMSIMCSAQWNNIYQDSTLIELRDLFFLNKDTGFVCGYGSLISGVILRTYDGGETWQNSILPQSNVVTSIDFINDSVGYSGGEDGAIYKTIDGGLTWDYLSCVIWPIDIEDIDFINDSIGFAKPYYNPLYKTIDGGISWTPVSPNINSFFYDGKNHSVYFFDDSNGFVVGDSVIYKTVDQGENWEKQNADSSKYYRAICMIDYDEGFAVGNNGVIAHTIDGGANWSIDSICDQDLRDIDFITDSIGFIIGGGHGYFNDTVGIVLITNDRGSTWETIIISEHILNAFFYADSVAYTVGNFGTIFKNENLLNPVDLPEFQYSKNELLIWPNPVKSEINFNLPTWEPVNLELIGLNGIAVFNYQNFSKRKIDISMIKNGLYIFKVNSKKNIFVKKVMINR